jgi:hypothetical protein
VDRRSAGRNKTSAAETNRLREGTPQIHERIVAAKAVAGIDDPDTGACPCDVRPGVDQGDGPAILKEAKNPRQDRSRQPFGLKWSRDADRQPAQTRKPNRPILASPPFTKITVATRRPMKTIGTDGCGQRHAGFEQMETFAHQQPGSNLRRDLNPMSAARLRRARPRVRRLAGSGTPGDEAPRCMTRGGQRCTVVTSPKWLRETVRVKKRIVLKDQRCPYSFNRRLQAARHKRRC